MCVDAQGKDLKDLELRIFLGATMRLAGAANSGKVGQELVPDSSYRLFVTALVISYVLT